MTKTTDHKIFMKLNPLSQSYFLLPASYKHDIIIDNLCTQTHKKMFFTLKIEIFNGQFLYLGQCKLIMTNLLFIIITTEHSLGALKEIFPDISDVKLKDVYQDNFLNLDDAIDEILERHQVLLTIVVLSSAFMFRNSIPDLIINTRCFFS